MVVVECFAFEFFPDNAVDDEGFVEFDLGAFGIGKIEWFKGATECYWGVRSSLCAAEG